MKTKVSKHQAFLLIRDALITTGLMKKIHFTENYNLKKPSEQVLMDTVPELHRELNCLGPSSAYCRCHIPLRFVISERVVTKEHFSQGFDYGEFTLTEREFFEGYVVIDLHQDKKDPSRGFIVDYSVDTDLKGWKTLDDMEAYPGHLERLVKVFRMVDALLSGLDIVESPEDFKWVQDLVSARTKPRKIEDIEDFGELCREVINEETHHDDPGIMKGLRKFLMMKGGTERQALDFTNLLDCLADDKNELRGSPDSNVVERFEEHKDGLFTILNDVFDGDFNLSI